MDFKIFIKSGALKVFDCNLHMSEISLKRRKFWQDSDLDMGIKPFF